MNDPETELAAVNRVSGALKDIDRSMQAKASSAGARINIPLNLNNWRDLNADLQADLLWFHQHLLDEQMTLEDAAEAANYDASTVFRALKGTYEGSYENFCKATRSYRKIAENRGKIQNSEFAPNRNSQLIFEALNYTVASNTICLVTGETGLSKSMSAEAWRSENNHGRTVLVRATEVCPVKGAMQATAKAVGVNKNGSMLYLRESIHRAFNKNRMLIVDEAHFLLPADPRSNPAALEFFRSLHDATKCGLCFIASGRFDKTLEKMEYHFEQLLGRIGLNVRLYSDLDKTDIEPLLSQYFSRITPSMLETSLLIANNQDPLFKGRLRKLVEILRLVSRLAAKAGQRPNESHFLKALALHKSLMGQIHTAK